MSGIPPPGSPSHSQNVRYSDDQLSCIAQYAVGLEEVDYDLYADYIGKIDQIYHNRIEQLMGQFRDYEKNS